MRLPAYCTQGRSRCGYIAVVENGKLTAVEPDSTYPTGAKLCPKGRAAPELVYHPDRLTVGRRGLHPGHDRRRPRDQRRPLQACVTPAWRTLSRPGSPARDGRHLAHRFQKRDGCNDQVYT